MAPGVNRYLNLTSDKEKAPMTPNMPPTPNRRSPRRLPKTWHLAWGVPLGVAVLGFVSAPPAAPDAVLPQDPPTDTVQVVAQCVGNGSLGFVSVNPWTVHLPLPTDDPATNSEILWVLDDASSDADSLIVEAKQRARWPFGLDRHAGNGRGPNRGARSGRLLRQVPPRTTGGQNPRPINPEGERFQYDIVVYCSVLGDNYTVIIDPDVDVGEGGP